MMSTQPLHLTHLLPAIDAKLMSLLRELSKEDWEKQTVAKKWKVKDVVAHLLDGNIRGLSLLRDDFFGEKFAGQSYEDLVAFLNGLNADWVRAMKRVSPEMLIYLYEATGSVYSSYLSSLDPLMPSKLAVSWAGESTSPNWMHTAREYTEKWLHQQQIRDAVGKPGILTAEFFVPFMDTCILALPFTLRDVDTKEGTSIRLTVTGPIQKSWTIARDKSWEFVASKNRPDADVVVPADIAWKLFSKSLRPDDVRAHVQIIGDRDLGETAIKMVSFMA